MIFGNIKDLNDYPFLEEGIRKAFAYTASTTFCITKKGSYPIDGEKLFVNIVEYRNHQTGKPFLGSSPGIPGSSPDASGFGTN